MPDTTYGQVSLAGELHDLARATEGARNKTLHKAWFKLVQRVDAGHLDYDGAYQRVYDTARSIGLPDREIRATMASAERGARQVGAAQVPAASSNGATGGREFVPLDRQPDIAASTPEGEAPNYDNLYLTVVQLDQLPQPEPLIENVLDDHMLFSIVGPGRSYKSFLGFDWLACLATGKRWLGHTVERRKVLYVVGEGAYGLAQRRDAWQLAWSRSIDPERFHVRRAPVNLFKTGSAYADLKARIEREQYGVILFDTLQRMTSGAERNSDKDAGLVIERLGELRTITDGTVGLVAHTGKNTEYGTRGSSAWEDDLDIVWRVRRDDDTGLIVAELAKRKDGPEGHRVELVPKPITGTKSLILEVSAGTARDQPPKWAYPVMRMLAGSAVIAEGMSMSAVGEALGLGGKGPMSVTFSWLQDRGFVQKCGNGRNTTFKLSPSGLVQLSSTEGK